MVNIEEARTETILRQGFHPRIWMLVLPLGSMMFLYLGWAYQASWYWYYGIDSSQLKIPLSVIVQQSMMNVSLSLSFLLIVFGIVFLFRLIVLAVTKFFQGDRRLELAKLFSLRDVFQGKIHFVALVYVALIYLFLKEVARHNSSTPKLEMPANIAALDLFIFPIAVILLLRLLGDFLYLLPTGVKQRLRLTSEARINDEPYRMILGILIMFAASVLFTGNMAVGDASVGFRDNASYQAVRRVYLKSDLPIAGLEPYRQGCDCNPYTYGPLGYLGNSDEYLFLVPWKAEGKREFPQFPPLYQIERSPTGTINIVPEGSPPAAGNGAEQY
jgi:hypothetical protein